MKQLIIIGSSRAKAGVRIVLQNTVISEEIFFTEYKGTRNKDLGFVYQMRNYCTQGKKGGETTVSEESGIMMGGTSFHPLARICGGIKGWFPFPPPHGHPQILQ